MGNAFLSNIKACDAIFHVTRAFEDEDITHVEGGVDPVRDLAIIAEELRLKVLEKAPESSARDFRGFKGDSYVNLTSFYFRISNIWTSS